MGLDMRFNLVTRSWPMLACVLSVAWLASPTVLHAKDEPVSFSRDVQAAMTKLGCNQGTCHGSQYGKGGFKLSLRGFDDNADYQAMVRSLEGRRVMLAHPEMSLLITKPMLKVAHKGGLRLKKDSTQYETLVKWIEQGAPGPNSKETHIKGLIVSPTEIVMKPGDEELIDVSAVFSDGKKVPVPVKTCYDAVDPTIAVVSDDGLVTAKGKGETSIMIRYLDQVAVCRIVVPYGNKTDLTQFKPRNIIDKTWVDKWKKLGLSPSELCSDEDFYRRIHLDTIGTLPKPEEIKKFLADKDPNKRDKAIDAVLSRPEYVDFWAYKWGDLLQNNRTRLGEKGMWALHNWLKTSFRKNKPMDQMFGEVVTAVGSPFQSGPANFYVGRSVGAADWAENTAQIFLGTRIQCARCHHHPFETFSQSDFYGMAAFFARIKTKTTREYGAFSQEPVIYTQDSGDTRHPRTGRILKPTPLGGDPVDDPFDRRRALAKWMSDRNNRLVARNIVNRYWGYYLGRGLVDPIDDMRVTNPPSNEATMDALADFVIKNNYDVKKLIRLIMQSRVYQGTSKVHPHAKLDVFNRYCTHYTVKRMTAEQMLDAVNYACGTTDRFKGLPEGYRAIQLPDTTIASRFLDTFGRPKREVTCECERTDTPNMAQALQLMTGNSLNGKIASGKGRIATLSRTARTPAQIASAIEELYFVTLSRPPKPNEKKQAQALVGEAENTRDGLQDLLWALLNMREFQFNH